ncbi:Gx transporter family protein [Sedimentibacter sp. zth1]|uniref:Gx transporter family protein n=1 Tax=Sedimentibacter sp. zth1 TaxID=2816908 RepID=UPI001A913A8E|nr:Gx transporter family protein [Sedimentibacter sp. zth1]QSX07016.1 Gx transporter family protein [Sedimentibacter sp. zth1]
MKQKNTGLLGLKPNSTKKLVITALLFAIALILSVVENMLPPLPIPVPGIKFGLANIVVMYTLFFINKSTAIILVVLKALFGVMTRGVVAGMLSLCGGLMSVLVMILLISIFKDKISYLILSIFGAVFHNIGQYIAISIIYVGMNLLFYLPVLLISGVLAGIVTSTLLKFILPFLNGLGFK